jgi:hypothetical protein
MNKLKENKSIYAILVLAIALFAVRVTCDWRGYRMLDVLKSPQDKEASNSSYGASHK